MSERPSNLLEVFAAAVLDADALTQVRDIVCKDGALILLIAILKSEQYGLNDKEIVKFLTTRETPSQVKFERRLND